MEAHTHAHASRSEDVREQVSIYTINEEKQSTEQQSYKSLS